MDILHERCHEANLVNPVVPLASNASNAIYDGLYRNSMNKPSADFDKLVGKDMGNCELLEDALAKWS